MPKKLKEALNVTKTVFNNYNIKINIGKTKSIACSTKSGNKRFNIKIGNGKIGKISELCYLGSKITRDGCCSADMRSRIGQAKKAFDKRTQLFLSNIDSQMR